MQHDNIINCMGTRSKDFKLKGPKYKQKRKEKKKKKEKRKKLQISIHIVLINY